MPRQRRNKRSIEKVKRRQSYVTRKDKKGEKGGRRRRRIPSVVQVGNAKGKVIAMAIGKHKGRTSDTGRELVGPWPPSIARSVGRNRESGYKIPFADPTSLLTRVSLHDTSPSFHRSSLPFVCSFDPLDCHRRHKDLPFPQIAIVIHPSIHLS